MRVGPEMLITSVDNQDNPIGIIQRRDAFNLRANFRVAHIFLFNQAGELLLQRIPERRHRHPNHWGSSVAAYLFADETYEAAARRRLKEELGIRDAVPHLLLMTSMRDQESQKFISLFKVEYDREFDWDDWDRSHIAELKFFRLDDIFRMVRDRQARHRFTPTFLHLLGEFSH